ncbi:MAG TPA: ubiquitin-like small modifier protein 1 [Anaerolineales bacterium]|nr:ubiquitin-like small modifier protein 1 [Anaerolineales bacterium]
MATMRIPTPLRAYTHGSSELEVKGSTVGEALQELTDQHPDLKQHLYTPDGELRSFVNLFVNDEDVRFLQGVDTPIRDHDRLMILPSIAGGLPHWD